MTLLINFDKRQNTPYVTDQSTKDILKKSYFGTAEGDRLVLTPEEALYLIDVRNASCVSQPGEAKLAFNDIASEFSNSKKFIARYVTYKDWRDRGLIIKEPEGETGDGGKAQHLKQYKATALRLKPYKLEGIFFQADLTTVIDDSEAGNEIYDEQWFGQYGTYKVKEHGIINKLDIYETLFLIDRFCIEAKELDKEGDNRCRNEKAARLPKTLRDIRRLEGQGLCHKDRLQVRHPFQAILPRGKTHNGRGVVGASPST